MGKIIIISGPSGVGKTSICKALCDTYESLIWSISATTRAKRDGEKDGQDYHFLSQETFMEKIKQNKFLEYAQVHGAYYGTLKDKVMEVLCSGCHCLMDIDVQGAKQIKEQKDLEVLAIFIAPPSLGALQERLQTRRSDSTTQIKMRMEKVSQELAEAKNYDHCIKNLELEETIAKVQSIVGEIVSSGEV